MLSVSDIKSAAAQAACFTCLPVNVQQAIKTYLLARVAGASTDPKTIMAAARRFIGLPPGTQLAIQAYAASVLSGAASASDFVKSQACAFQCTPAQMGLPIAINQLANRAGVSPVPKTLAALASGFVGLPPGYLSALNTFLMAVIAGISTNAATAAQQAACFTCLPPANLENITTLIWTDVALPAPTGFTLVINPDGSVDIIWNTPPPGVSYTALYLSFACDYNFVLYANVAAPGTTLHIPGILGLTPGICIEIRSCSAAGLCSPPVGTGTQGGGPFICPTMTVGAVLLDTMQSYTDQAALNGLNGGSGWCVISPYVDRTAYLGLQALDTMQSYTNGANLLGLNGGTGWNGAYGADNISVQINALNEWPVNGSNTTISVTATSGFPAYSYQWFKNGSALSNVGHYSGATTATLTITGYDASDNASYFCTVTDTTGRSTTSQTCVTAIATTPGQLWAALVAQTNGGGWPSANTVSATDTFNTAIASIAAKIYHANLIAPDNIIAMRTPFIHTFGNSLWVRHTLGAGGNEVISAAGWNPSTNRANTFYYDTGVVPSAIPSFSPGNGGCSVYVASAITTGLLDGTFGAYNGPPNNALALQVDVTGFGIDQFFAGNAASGFVQVATSGTGGFFMTSRTTTTDNRGFKASSVLPWQQWGATNVTLNSVTPCTLSLPAGAFNQAGGFTGNAATFSWFAVHDGLTSAEGQLLFNAVQAFRVAIGGGFL